MIHAKSYGIKIERSTNIIWYYLHGLIWDFSRELFWLFFWQHNPKTKKCGNYAIFGTIIQKMVSQQFWIAIYLPGPIYMKKMSKVGSWWLRNHRALDLELRLNKKDLWADSHKYWNYVFMHLTISDFESTTSSAS